MPNRKFFAHSVAVLFVLTLLSIPFESPAQTTAAISGTVTDSSGAVVPNVSLTVVQKETGFKRQVESNASGLYVVPALQVGTYSITSKAAGFKTETITGIVLQVNQEARVNIVLQVGAVSESVTVTAETSLLQSESASVGQVIDNRYNTQIPLNGRDFASLILLIPGANTRPGGIDQTIGATIGSNGSGFAIGGREAHNNFMMDGASNNTRQYGSIAIHPSIDAVQEFKVQSSSYAAEFGQAAFGQINLVTKSGGNAFHGSAFEFLRNNALDARNFFLPNVSKLNRNQFGGTLGGPIIRNKTFFFVNYEGLRERRGVEVFRSVPNEAWRGGNFSAITTSLKDPLTGQNFPGNIIPASRFVKPAQVALSHWPKANYGAASLTANNLFISAPDKFRDDQITVKGDQELTSRDRLMARYSMADHWQITSAAMLPGFEYIDPPRNHVFVLSETHIFNPRLLGDYHFSFTRSLFKRTYPNTGKAGVFEEYGINHQLDGPQFEGAPSYSFSGIALTSFGDSTTLPLLDISNEFTHAASATWTKGNHTLKTGLSFTKYQQNTPGAIPGNRRGAFAFAGYYTGNAFSDMLLGYPWQVQRTVGKGVQTGRSTWQAYYWQDDWKVNRKLTLNLGLRYEYISPIVDVFDTKSIFWPLTNDFNTGLPGQIIVAKSTEAASMLKLKGVGARALYAPDRNNFAPRLGIAYTLTPKTVIRTGYGIFYTVSQNFVNNFVINRGSPPSAEKQLRTSSTTKPEINLADPFLGAGPASVTATQNINPDFVEGYVQHWNFIVQHELKGGLSFEVGYVGNKGTKLTELPYYNIPLPQKPGDTRSIQDRRPLPLWGTALGMSSYVTSSYNSLQVKTQKRFSHGLQFLASYTWAKSIDLSSERGSGDRAGIDGGDERNLRGYFRGLSGFDVRQRLVMSYVYDLPFGRGRGLLKNIPAIADKIIGGWQLSGITQFQGGFPFTVLMSGDQNGDGLSGDRPDLIGKPVINPGNPNCYIADARNAACGSGVAAVFAAVPAAQARFGSAGRNILIGPGLRQWDVNVSKHEKLTERLTLQFRAEFFNFFNNVNFNNPSRTYNVTAPMFGTINSAGRAREMQFGMKLEF